MLSLEKLKELESEFLDAYPQGFEDEFFFPTMKKFNPSKLSLYTFENLKKENFSNPNEVVQIFLNVIVKSVLVSLFDKLKLKDMINSLNSYEKDMLSIEIYELIHGNKKEGFEGLVEFLSQHNLAKWTIISVVPYYFDRNKNYFIKPTTTKNILKYLEINDLKYNSKPSYEFYEAYSKNLDLAKKNVDKSLSFDNAAFTGFLKVAIEICNKC